jgi:PAS domain S-box-containing protein
LGSRPSSTPGSEGGEPRRRPRFVAYVSALALVCSAAILYSLFFPNAQIPFITFYPCVFLVALLFGAGPAIVSALLSAFLANWVFMGEPFTWSITPRELGATLTFLFLSISTAVLAEWQRRTQQRLQLESAERARSELSERQLRTYLEQILKGMTDALISVDHEGRVEMMNGAAEQLTGYSLSEVRGRSVESVYVTEDEASRKVLRPAVFEALRQGVATGLANHKLLIRRDGQAVAIDDSASPIRDATGAIVGAVLLFRDMEERRNSQRSLERSERQLTGILESIGAADLRESPGPGVLRSLHRAIHGPDPVGSLPSISRDRDVRSPPPRSQRAHHRPHRALLEAASSLAGGGCIPHV